MANPHSLPLMGSPSTPHAKPTQLPFAPSSPSVISRFQLPPSPIKPQTFGQAPLRPHNRSESIASKHTRGQRSSSNATDFGSSTHAGGVLPSSSFFHPSKPNTRPSSMESAASQELPDSLRVVHENPPSLDAEDESLQRQLSTSTRLSKRQKQSREPLLPIGGPIVRRTSGTTPTRPSFSITPTRPSFGTPSHRSFGSQGNLSFSQLSYPTSPSSPSRVRTSLDKFKKRISVDCSCAYHDTRVSSP
jgi:palmitoyltransferase ZDHHC9/14/18